jgi:leucyl-tRNA synthetase
LRDAVSLQRIGEAFPVYYVNGLPQMIDATFANHFTVSQNLDPPPLGNAAVWAWDSVNNKVVKRSTLFGGWGRNYFSS